MINCIVAIENHHGIGFNNSMPWPRLKHDLKWFKEKTQDHVVLMGRKTWNSIGDTPLPNRINIVVSSSKVEGCDFCAPLEKINLIEIQNTWPNKELFIIGGESIYKNFLTSVNRFYITEINEHYQCDRFFDFSWVKNHCTKVIEHATFNDPINYTIREYRI